MSPILAAGAATGARLERSRASNRSWPSTSSVGEASVDFTLGEIGPNPSAGAPVRIEYSVGREAAVRLSILDVQGRLRAVLADGVMRAGRYKRFGAWRGGASGDCTRGLPGGRRTHTRRWS
jgi:hypothetical protein